jgi:hypothetical protein
MAPSKFWALSRSTAVFALWRAWESIAFCDGCFELRDEPLLFPFCERFREWPLDLRPSPRSLERCRLLGDPEAGDGDILLFAALDREGDLLSVLESHVEK